MSIRLVPDVKKKIILLLAIEEDADRKDRFKDRQL